MCKHDWLEKPDYGAKVCAKCGKIEPCIPEPKLLNHHKNGWQEIELIKGLPFTEGTTSWCKNNLKVLFSPRELHTETDLGGGYWKHLSISHPHRYPYWDEILNARNTFFSEIETVIQIMPPTKEYVNFHPNCFHLWSKISE
ncbi:MAG: hypothetical protein KKB38_20400 [Gammaproteobacteria bacterium]|nr:hypothetical protein [Gammaproteobacteria bacterium]